MTFCTPVTPTRERLTLVVGRRDCTSSAAVWSREIGSSIRPRKLARKRKCDFARSGVWWPRGRVLEDSQPEAPGHSRLVSRQQLHKSRVEGRPPVGPAGRGSLEGSDSDCEGRGHRLTGE